MLQNRSCVSRHPGHFRFTQMLVARTGAFWGFSPQTLGRVAAPAPRGKNFIFSRYFISGDFGVDGVSV